MCKVTLKTGHTKFTYNGEDLKSFETLLSVPAVGNSDIFQC